MYRASRFLVPFVLVALFASCGPAPAGDHEGPSFAAEPATSTPGSPTGSKPESKLWFHDGTWWAVMFDGATTDHYIFRLDAGSQRWTRTATVLDTRTSSRSDVVFDGTKLYVASHVFDENPPPASPDSYLYRLSYDGGTDTWVRDSGFPEVLNPNASETLVLAKDSTGQLWATWTQADQVHVNRTTAGDRTWGTPFVLSGPTGLVPDDISSVVAFGGDRVGIMWSSQTVVAGSTTFGFSVHRDDQPDTTWDTPEVASTGPAEADDHLNLKADGTGRVYAAVKTSRQTNTDARVRLLVRGPAGGWTSSVVWTAQDDVTRPIVVLDSSSGGRVHVFATGPHPPSGDGEGGGDVYRKTSPAATPTFDAGLGTPVISDGTSPNVNNATAAKQGVTPASGMVVLASDTITDRYWHAWQPLS